jgi:hypothetical protein
MFKNICIGLCTAAFLFVTVQAGLFVRDLRAQMPRISQTVQDVDKSVQNLDKVITKTSVVVDNVNATATGEQKFLLTESREFLKTTAAIKQIIVSTDYNLNKSDTGLLPRLNSALYQQNTAFLALQAQAKDSLARTSVALDGLPPIEKNLSDVILKVSDAVDQVTPEVVSTTKAVNATAKDGQEVADAYKQKLLHPLNSVYNDFKAVLGITVSFLEIHAFWP